MVRRPLSRQVVSPSGEIEIRMKRRVRETSDRQISPERTCAFCGAKVPAGHEVFGFGAKARPDADIECYRGAGIEITVRSLKRNVVAIVTGRDSPAARAGHDLYFTSSESCANSLKAALEEDIKGGGLLPA